MLYNLDFEEEKHRRIGLSLVDTYWNYIVHFHVYNSEQRDTYFLIYSDYT